MISFASFRQGWERFWFPSEPAQSLAVCRILLFGGIFFAYLSTDLTHCHEAAHYFWQPISFYKWFEPAGPPGEAFLALLQIIWKISLFTSIIGLFTRPSTILASALGIYLIGLPYNFGKPEHNNAAAVIGTLVLAFSECGKIGSVDAFLARRRGTSYPPLTGPDAGWPIQLMRVTICLVFFGAGLNKLRTSGLDWAISETLQMNLILSDTPFSRAISQWPWVCHVMAIFTLCTEFLQPLSLVSKHLAMLLVPAAISLVIGICVVMDFPFEMLAYIQFFWLPWGRIFPPKQI